VQQIKSCRRQLHRPNKLTPARRLAQTAVLEFKDRIDAMFNLALLLQRKGAYGEAADYWRQYLADDRASPDSRAPT
jgi:hypothetical protein